MSEQNNNGQVIKDAGGYNDTVTGSSGADTLGGCNGGNDTLRGGSGNDVYLLGRGTDHDIIEENSAGRNDAGDAGDVIRIKSGIAPDNVRLRHSGDDLIVELLDGSGGKTDSIRVRGYYVGGRARVERLEFEDSGLWFALDDFDIAPDSFTDLQVKKGDGSDGQQIAGSRTNDIFDSGSGNQTLYGGSGDDIYWLGRGSGYDLVREFDSSLHRLNIGRGGNDVIRLKSDISVNDVRLRRAGDGLHLLVELLAPATPGQPESRRTVTDSIMVDAAYRDGIFTEAQVERVEFADGTVWNWADFASRLEIGDGPGDDLMTGNSSREDYPAGDSDIFDGDAGGNDILRGLNGNDVYRLGRGTDHDTIREYYGNYAAGDAGDVIEVKTGIDATAARLRRSADGYHLIVELPDGQGGVPDSLTVARYYTDARARVEQVKFADGEIWDANDFAAAKITGGSGDDVLSGLDSTSDVFDSNAGGNDVLFGFGKGDVYWLGQGTGHDIIRESAGIGDYAGDAIMIKKEVDLAKVHLRGSDNGDLIVEIKNGSGSVTDSLTVKDFYASVRARVELVKRWDGSVLWDGADLDAAFAGITLAEGENGGNRLYGSPDSDVFDSDGGDRRRDALYGGGGDDIYYLGYGTGHDTIMEHSGGSGNDVIKIKPGIAAADVRLRRSNDGWGVLVELLDSASRDQPLSRRSATDSLTVDGVYRGNHQQGDLSGNPDVERIEFSDGTVWNWAEFANTLEITGDAGDNTLTGNSAREDYPAGDSDIFDGDAGGNDILRGLVGNDVYRLGHGTGHDTIQEYHSGDSRHPYRDTGDAGDVIEIKSGIGTDDVRLRRAGDDLFVELIPWDDNSRLATAADWLKIEDYYTRAAAKVESVKFADGTVWNAAFLSAAAERTYVTDIGGGDLLIGTAGADVFDSNVGGRFTDVLLGGSGDDVYWLGQNIGHDLIVEINTVAGAGIGSGGSDVIKIKSGIDAADVQLRRSDDGEHLYVELLTEDGAGLDSLTVGAYYTDDAAKVERVEFADGLAWDADDFAAAEITGGSDNDSLLGTSHTRDIFDSDAGGNDTLQGRGGDDVYWLGRGSGRDKIQEYENNSAAGDDGDVIKIKSGIDATEVRLSRSSNGDHLIVQLLNADDSLTIENYYKYDNAKVERLEFEESGLWFALDDFELARNSSVNLNIKRGDGTYGIIMWGSRTNDIFDSGAGFQALFGGSGDDIYWLGRGSGNDLIREYDNGIGSGGNDVIRIKSGIEAEDVRLRRSNDGWGMFVELLDPASRDQPHGRRLATDSLLVDAAYHGSIYNTEVERIEFSDGTVWNWADFADTLEIMGGEDDDTLTGNSARDNYPAGNADIFDSDAGGNDILQGMDGNDVYWLGRGTDHDIIREYYGKDENLQTAADSADVIKIKAGTAVTDVRLRRGGEPTDVVNTLSPSPVTRARRNRPNPIFIAPKRMQSHNLIIELLNADGIVTDSLTVEDHYVRESAKIERVELMSADKDKPIKVWNADNFAKAEIRRPPGSAGIMYLEGLDGMDDVFNSVGGSDILRGRGGNDEYWLGTGTGFDTIQEYYDKDGNERTTGDSADVIRIKEGLSDNQVHLVRSNDGNGNDLIVEVKENGVRISSLTIENFKDASARIERVEFMDGTVWNEAYLDAKFEGRELQEGSIGTDGDDAFDNDDGTNAALYGKDGNDAYWLGYGTGHDTIHEYENSRTRRRGRSRSRDRYIGNNDPNDVIRIKSEITDITNVRLSTQRRGWDLKIEIRDSNGDTTDSLTVRYQYSIRGAEIERIEAAGHVLLENQFKNLIDELVDFTAGESDFADEAAIYEHFWNDNTALTTPGG